MARFPSFALRGVIPAVLLPFHDDLSIAEAEFRSHLRDVGGTAGISAITVNGHSTEVSSCTFDAQRLAAQLTRAGLQRAAVGQRQRDR